MAETVQITVLGPFGESYEAGVLKLPPGRWELTYSTHEDDFIMVLARRMKEVRPSSEGADE